MKVAPHIQTIEAIRAAIASYHAAAAEFAKDVTLRTAREAFTAAEKNKARADLEDDSVDAEELVDRRMEAERQFQVAKIRVDRAEKSHTERQSDVNLILRQATREAAKAFPIAAEALAARLTAAAVRVYGADIVELHEKQRFDLLHYSMGRRVHEEGECLRMSRSEIPEHAIGHLENAIAILEDVYRDR
jgi:hypothetical protein